MKTVTVAKAFQFYTAERELRIVEAGAEIEVADEDVEAWTAAGLITAKKAKTKAELAAEAKAAADAKAAEEAAKQAEEDAAKLAAEEAAKTK